MHTLTRPACTAQYTDRLDTRQCSGRHIDGWHTTLRGDGSVEHLWLDPHADTGADRYGPLLHALADLHAAVRGRTIHDTRVRAVIDAYDALIQPTGVAS